jgi:hypothetical protein
MPIKQLNCLKTFLIFSVLLLSVSCTKNKCEDSKKITGCVSTCTNNGICTDIFIHSTLSIKNLDGSSYKLDSFKTLRIEDNKTLDPNIQYSENGTLDSGDYPLFNDNFISLTSQCGKEFYFIGYKDNIEVVKEKYVFGHDCCHMLRFSGKTALIIQ